MIKYLDAKQIIYQKKTLNKLYEKKKMQKLQIV